MWTHWINLTKSNRESSKGSEGVCQGYASAAPEKKVTKTTTLTLDVQMTREWHAGYYMARNVNSPRLSFRVVNSPPLNTRQNTTRHSVTRKSHAGRQLYRHIYPGKVWSPGLRDCVHQELLYLEKGPKERPYQPSYLIVAISKYYH